MGLATLLPLLGFALFYSRRFGVMHSVALLQMLSAIVLVLYVGGLAAALWWTALAIHIGGLVLLGREIWLVSQNRSPVPVSVPLIVLGVATVAFWFVHGNNQYVYYDEFAHWGVYIREMLIADGFWGADTNSMHPRYPPAAPLWQYLFNVFGEPREGTAYLAHFVLLVTPLLVLFERIGKRSWYWAPLVVALCLLALTNFGHGITSLYVDHVIGVWFVGTILCFVLESPGFRRSLIYILPLTVLAMLKESSFEFALAAAGILGVLAGLRQWLSSKRLRSAMAGGVTTFGAIAFSALLALQVWDWHLDRIGATGDDVEAVGGIVAGITGERATVDAEQGAEITRRFLEVLWGQQLGKDQISAQFNAFSYSISDLFTDTYRMSTLGFAVIYVVWWILLIALVLRRGEARVKWALVACGVLGTAVAFVGALYLRYRYASGEYGLILSSYLRYVHMIALPMLIVGFAPLLPVFRDASGSRNLSLGGRSIALPSLLAIVGCAALYVFERPYLRPVMESNSVVPLRQDLELATSGFRSVIGDASVWIYLPNDYPNGFVGELLQYLFIPATARVERDAAYLEGKPAELMATWSEFDYVWIAGELEPENAALLSDLTGFSPDDRFFRVTVDALGKPSLELIDTSS